MIDVYMYCSYNGSAVGFCEAAADRRTGKITTGADAAIPKIIDTIWTHGGAMAAAGCEKEYCYLVVKGMNAENDCKEKFDKGRNIFANIAFSSANSESEDFENFVRGFFAQYKAIEKAICKMMIISTASDIGYELDFEKLEEVIVSCTALGKGIKGTAEDRFKIEFNGNKERIAFLALEATEKYFFDMCKISSRTHISRKQSRAEYESRVLDSRSELFNVNPQTQPPTPDDAEIKERVSKVEDKLDAIMSELNNLKMPINNSDSGITEDKQQLLAIEDSLRSMKSNISELQSAINDVNITLIDSRLNRIDDNIAQLQKKPNESNAAAPSDIQLDVIETEIDKLQAAMNGMDIASINGKINSAERMIGELNKKSDARYMDIRAGMAIRDKLIAVILVVVLVLMLGLHFWDKHSSDNASNQADITQPISTTETTPATAEETAADTDSNVNAT